jgi:hypothetical protein
MVSNNIPPPPYYNDITPNHIDDNYFIIYNNTHTQFKLIFFNEYKKLIYNFRNLLNINNANYIIIKNLKHILCKYGLDNNISPHHYYNDIIPNPIDGILPNHADDIYFIIYNNTHTQFELISFNEYTKLIYNFRNLLKINNNNNIVIKNLKFTLCKYGLDDNLSKKIY